MRNLSLREKHIKHSYKIVVKIQYFIIHQYIKIKIMVM
jgi:hypothetical protein